MNHYKPTKQTIQMKTKPTLLLSAALLVTAACTSDNDTVTNPDAPVPVSITAGMASDATATPDTRAIDDRWNCDNIGVMVISSPGSDMATRYRNARYVTTSTTSTAEFAPADPNNTIYFAGSDDIVTFRVYAPYQPSATPGELPGTNGVITIDATRQSTPAEQEAIDFLISGEVPAWKALPTVAFSGDEAFRHIMARLVLHIQTPVANGFSPDDVERISRISLGGLCTGGTLEFISSPQPSIVVIWNDDPATRTADWDIAGYVHAVGPDKNNVMQRTHTLIFPGQWVTDMNGHILKAVPIAITLDGQVYRNDKDITGSADAVGDTGNFRSGTSYEYTIRLKKTGLEVTGATIQDWGDGGTGSGDATKQ